MKFKPAKGFYKWIVRTKYHRVKSKRILKKLQKKHYWKTSNGISELLSEVYSGIDFKAIVYHDNPLFSFIPKKDWEGVFLPVPYYLTESDET